jgi:hypothetical protein
MKRRKVGSMKNRKLKQQEYRKKETMNEMKGEIRKQTENSGRVVIPAK